MQTPTSLVLWWIFIAIGNSAPDLDADLFDDVALDPTLFSDEQSIVSSGLTADLNLGLFTDDNDQLGPTSDANSNFFLANEIDCDTSNADSLLLFGKMRRSETCQSPPTEKLSPSGADPLKKDDPFGFIEFINQDPSFAGFLESSDKCPAKVFEISLIPVCTKQSSELRMMPNSNAVTLYDVDSGAFIHD